MEKNIGGRPPKYTKEQLIDIMRNAPIKTYDYFNSKDSGVPSATVYRRYFGSWGEALKAAGVKQANCVMKADTLTRMYLVKFEEGYYKLGITQQSIKQRLGGRYPKYEIIWDIEYDTLASAREAEKECLEYVKPYKYVPTNFPIEGRGFTECFKFS